VYTTSSAEHVLSLTRNAAQATQELLEHLPRQDVPQAEHESETLSQIALALSSLHIASKQIQYRLDILHQDHTLQQNRYLSDTHKKGLSLERAQERFASAVDHLNKARKQVGAVADILSFFYHEEP